MQPTADEKKRYRFVFYLKTIAVLLIINSHFDTIYPIPQLATGGALGNGLFFAISGFCLTSFSDDFGKWYLKRLKRLYVPTLIMAAVYLLKDTDIDWTLLGLVKRFVFPTRFWFVGAIALFYVFLYIFRNMRSNKAFIRLAAGLAALYFACYFLFMDTARWVVEEPGLNNAAGYFKLIYCFAAMMTGRYFYLHRGEISCGKLTALLNTILSFVSLYGVKIIFNHYPALMPLQFLNQFSVIWFTVSVFLFGMAMEPQLEARKGKWHARLCEWVAGLTLEVYLVQYFVIRFAEKVFFPLNAVLSIIGIFVGAVILRYVTKLVIGLFPEKAK